MESLHVIVDPTLNIQEKIDTPCDIVPEPLNDALNNVPRWEKSHN